MRLGPEAGAQGLRMIARTRRRHDVPLPEEEIPVPGIDGDIPMRS